MMKTKKLPVGIDDFEKLIRQDFYYIDKTGMIADLLRNRGGSEQIEDKQYAMKLKSDGMRTIIKYGIACFKKDCKVVIGE